MELQVDINRLTLGTEVNLSSFTIYHSNHAI